MCKILRWKISILILCLTTILRLSALAQSPAPEREKPRLKDFGSSLKRLKWDPNRNIAAETRPRKRNGATDDDVVRVETDLVVTDLLVLDKEWRLVQGLTRDDFIIYEDGKPHKVGAFALGDDANIARSIVLIIDYSGSQLPFIKTSVKAAKTLVDKLNPRDLMAIVTDDVELLVDFTRDKKRLKQKLDSLETKTSGGPGSRKLGRSAQYSALMATLREAFGDEDQRAVIIFQTDGDEYSYLRNSTVLDDLPPNLPQDLQERLKRLQRWRKIYRYSMREFSLDDVYRAAENSRATIYTIVPGIRLIGFPPDQVLERLKAANERMGEFWEVSPEVKRQAEEEFRRYSPELLKYIVEQSLEPQLALARVAQLTGGWIDFVEDPAQADDIYNRIFSDINRRYVVGYYPTNKDRDGKRRKVNVEVRGHPEYVVWGRKSYYAPEPE